MLVRVGLNVVKRRRNILPALTVIVADELGPEKAETTVTFQALHQSTKTRLPNVPVKRTYTLYLHRL